MLAEPRWPTSRCSEQIVVGAAILIPTVLAGICRAVEGSDFSAPRHRMLFESLCSAGAEFGHAPDLVVPEDRLAPHHG